MRAEISPRKRRKSEPSLGKQQKKKERHDNIEVFPGLLQRKIDRDKRKSNPQKAFREKGR
jgi:hypothetical protein